MAGQGAGLATLQAQLRAEHSKTHLTQTQLLSAEQMRRYAVLRGYAADVAPKSGDEGQTSHRH